MLEEKYPLVLAVGIAAGGSLRRTFLPACLRAVLPAVVLLLPMGGPVLSVA